ncbi:MAG: CoA-transferase [Metallosphaera sp.]|uniref:CoA-transferase subunit beta n=1 Tax=Metallosphaera sp. TaxID=2020860 RepID=UPI003161DCE5
MKIDYVIKAIAELIDNGELVYVGLNSGPALLASFLARDFQKKNIQIVGVAEAYNPKNIILSPSTGDPFFIKDSPVMITADSFDLAQKGRLDVMFLGPVQVDQETNINLTAIGRYERPKVKLPGGAATAYLMPLAKKVILWNLKHSKNSIVKRVDFVTGTARNSDNEVFLVTNLAVFKFDREKRTWTIVSIYPWSELEDIVNNTGFHVELKSDKMITVSPEESAYINTLDPYNLRSALE